MRWYDEYLVGMDVLHHLDERLDRLERALETYFEHAVENAHARNEALSILREA